MHRKNLKIIEKW